ncbi:hypothetical protein CBER1_03811 [Cercospora berteroae]|uniref:Autophagy-related protein n=1 Tax=Cercospora berteroae TaxID=357750 RepID=A0A2S6C811_9PEZI|nr:hypothetical protein CBER1_03811 [Cercospora berteroae]
MASADPGLAQATAPAEGPTKGAIVKDNGSLVETEHPVAPDQHDLRYETSRNEIWAYYSYYVGNNGLTLFNFAPTAAQNLLSQHAEEIGGPDNDIVLFAGSRRTINSVILLCNGISFAIQIFENGEITKDEYDHADSMKRNELSNTAFYVQSVAEIFILAVIVGIGFGMHVNAGTANNNYGLSVLIAFASGVWMLVAIPWFVLEKRRPGQDPGMNILKQSLFYLIGYFLLGDSLNTTVTVIATLQNQIVAYNFLELTYLLIVGIAAQAVGIFVYWNIQKRYQLPTKTMFNAVAVGIILLDAWGMIGIWTQRFGFHNKWEVWLYQVF